MTATVRDLPDEVVEQIYVNADPQDFVALASSCHRYHDILHKSNSQFVWRSHFLQRFDDPRLCITRLGERVASDVLSFDWKAELQRRIRAQSIILNPSLCRSSEVLHVLQTLVSMIIETPSATQRTMRQRYRRIFSGYPRSMHSATLSTPCTFESCPRKRSSSSITSTLCMV